MTVGSKSGFGGNTNFIKHLEAGERRGLHLRRLVALFFSISKMCQFKNVYNTAFQPSWFLYVFIENSNFIDLQASDQIN